MFAKWDLFQEFKFGLTLKKKINEYPINRINDKNTQSSQQIEKKINDIQYSFLKIKKKI